MRRVIGLILYTILFVTHDSMANTEYVRDFENIVPPSECTKVERLDQNMGPARSQTNSQWCYAFQVADLLAAEIGKPISAADVALTYNDFEDRRVSSAKEKKLHTQMQSGGEPRRALQWMMKRGICLEQDFPSEGYLVRRSANSGEELRLISILAEIEDYQRKIQSERTKDCEVCASYIVRQRDIYSAVFPHLSDVDLMIILKRADEFSVLSELQEKNCQGRRQNLTGDYFVQSVRGYPGEKFNPLAQENILRRMHSKLTI
jgi:hypothetical protein